jgi:O-antigen ligase
MSRANTQHARQGSPVVVLLLAAALLVVLLVIIAVVDLKAYRTRGISTTLPEPMLNAKLRLGVNADLGQYDDGALLIALGQIKASGITAIKQSFYFQDDFDWSWSDHLINAVVAEGIDLVPLLDGNPDVDFQPPDEPSAFAAWAGAFARRYAEQIRSYIIWDEPNLTSHWGKGPVNAAEYAAILSAASTAIREADSTAVIVAAPLAPTVETGGMNLADSLFLEDLYQAGAAPFFDVVAGKPYGFDTGPDDRRVDLEVLNFSHIILLREAMEKHGDSAKAIWAGNWGWNALPDSWRGAPSIWGQVDEATQARWTSEAVERARREWPWMGTMFVENWQPAVADDDPRWGFSIAGRETAKALAELDLDAGPEYPGFSAVDPSSADQIFEGQWRFAPEFGADVGQDGDKVTFSFWGTDVGLRVRRADYHARFYLTVDGAPANSLPIDDRGAALVLNSPDPSLDYLSTELVARGLEPGKHTMTVVALRGSNQWALNGFSVGYQPKEAASLAMLAVLSGAAAVIGLLVIAQSRRVDWRSLFKSLSGRYSLLGQRRQLLLTSVAALATAIAGWLAWSEQAGDFFRRLGDGGQIALTALAASTFYFAPSIAIYLIALALLFGLVYLRPQWGLALVAFSIPFYVKPKPMLGYRFSPVEVFLLVTLAAFALRVLVQKLAGAPSAQRVWNHSFRIQNADRAALAFGLVATLSLFFTRRLDVATNEWRVLVTESIIFYLLIRRMKLNEDESWTILDAYILGGVLVAVLGLWQYATGQNLITSEGGLMRLRSVYGSPNNVALFLGRMIPVLVAFLVVGSGRRRWTYSVALIPVGLAMLLSFSKGALFLGLPASLLVVLILWRRSLRARIWPWLVGFGLAALVALVIGLQIPQLAGRLNPQGETGFFRVNLWRSSWNMFVDHPLFGVGLDNFLYEYRGRYIMDSAWQEPNLSHPHNVLLDFATRLGLAGLLAGFWLLSAYARVTVPLFARCRQKWRPVAIGLIGAIVYSLAHGLVDHSFFLVDLAFTFFLMLGLAVWIQQNQVVDGESVT